MKKENNEGRKNRMIRLIHTSDLHLDSEFSCNDPKLTSLRKKNSVLFLPI